MATQGERLLKEREVCYYNKAGCCSKIFFQWAYFFIKRAKKGKNMSIKDYGSLPDQHRVEPKIKLFEESYRTAKRPSLIWSLLTIFKADFIWVFVLTLTLSALNIASPVLVNLIMRFLEDKDPDDLNDTLYGF